MKFGYMRVSTIDQNLDRQKKQLEDFGCKETREASWKTESR
ncbi:recombinase family protein [Peribacillus loiseleuriae]